MHSNTYHIIILKTSSLAMSRALEIEGSPQAKDAILQILTNSKLAAYGNRPICQDTGIVTVFR